MNLNFLRKKNPLQPPSSMYQQGMSNGDDDNEENDTEDDNDEDDSDTPDDSDAAASDAGDDTEEQLPVGTQPQSNTFQNYLSQMANRPQGPFNQKFADYLNQPIPTKEQYKPSKMNRLGAIMGGASEAYFRGPAAGMKLKESILDKPYQEAMNRYALTGRNLEKGAENETRGEGRAASAARTAMLGEHNERLDAINKIKAEAQARHWNASDTNAATNATSKGWTHHISPVDGHLIFARPNGKGGIESLDGGKAGESIPEATKRKLDEAEAREKLTKTRQIAVGAANAEARAKEDEARSVNRQIEDNKKAAIQQQLIKDRGEQTRLTGAAKPETTETKVTDAQGNVTGTRTTTTKKGSGKISVIRLSDGLSGTIDEKDFDPAKYKRQ